MRQLLLTLALIVACIIVGASQNALAFQFAQAVVVNSEKSTAYLMAPEASINEVDLSSGQLLATSTQGAKPILLYHSVLLAQAEPHEQSEGLRLVGLNSRDLAITFEVDVPLPAGVQALIDDRLGASFHVSAHIDAGEIVVQWRAIQRQISGTPTNEPAHIATGWARIDPNDGRITNSGSGEAAAPGSAVWEMPAVVQKLVDSGALATQPCRVDDIVAAIQYREDDGRTTVILRRWQKETGASLPDVKLFTSELTFRSFSVDCRYLLASKAMDGWAWSIYSTKTGDLVTELHTAEPASQFFVWDGSLFYVSPAIIIRADGQLKIDQPRRLLAIDLKTGKGLWSRPIRDTAYLGPYPAKLPNVLTR
jgi:hypothetical protein